MSVVRMLKYSAVTLVASAGAERIITCNTQSAVTIDPNLKPISTAGPCTFYYATDPKVEEYKITTKTSEGSTRTIEITKDDILGNGYFAALGNDGDWNEYTVNAFRDKNSKAIYSGCDASFYSLEDTRVSQTEIFYDSFDLDRTFAVRECNGLPDEDCFQDIHVVGRLPFPDKIGDIGESVVIARLMNTTDSEVGVYTPLEGKGEAHAMLVACGPLEGDLTVVVGGETIEKNNLQSEQSCVVVKGLTEKDEVSVTVRTNDNRSVQGSFHVDLGDLTTGYKIFHASGDEGAREIYFTSTLLKLAEGEKAVLIDNTSAMHLERAEREGDLDEDKEDHRVVVLYDKTVHNDSDFRKKSLARMHASDLFVARAVSVKNFNTAIVVEDEFLREGTTRPFELFDALDGSEEIASIILSSPPGSKKHYFMVNLPTPLDLKNEIVLGESEPEETVIDDDDSLPFNPRPEPKPVAPEEYSPLELPPFFLAAVGLLTMISAALTTFLWLSGGKKEPLIANADAAPLLDNGAVENAPDSDGLDTSDAPVAVDSLDTSDAPAADDSLDTSDAPAATEVDEETKV